MVIDLNEPPVEGNEDGLPDLNEALEHQLCGVAPVQEVHRDEENEHGRGNHHGLFPFDLNTPHDEEQENLQPGDDLNFLEDYLNDYGVYADVNVAFDEEELPSSDDNEEVHQNENHPTGRKDQFNVSQRTVQHVWNVATSILAIWSKIHTLYYFALPGTVPPSAAATFLATHRPTFHLPASEAEAAPHFAPVNLEVNFERGCPGIGWVPLAVQQLGFQLPAGDAQAGPHREWRELRLRFGVDLDREPAAMEGVAAPTPAAPLTAAASHGAPRGLQPCSPLPAATTGDQEGEIAL